MSHAHMIGSAIAVGLPGGIALLAYMIRRKEPNE